MASPDFHPGLVVLTGPSGVGKDALLALAAQKSPLDRVVTYTDRPKKPDEVDGFHYHFVETPVFEAMIRANGFLEYVRYGANPEKGIPGTYKGTTKDSLHPKDKPLVWRIDPLRAATVQESLISQLGHDQALGLLAQTVIVYVGVESVWNLRARQTTRDGACNPHRLREDIRVWRQYGHKFTNVIINRQGQLDVAVNEFLHIISDPTRKVKM